MVGFIFIFKGKKIQNKALQPLQFCCAGRGGTCSWWKVRRGDHEPYKSMKQELCQPGLVSAEMSRCAKGSSTEAAGLGPFARIWGFGPPLDSRRLSSGALRALRSPAPGLGVAAGWESTGRGCRELPAPEAALRAWLCHFH